MDSFLIAKYSISSVLQLHADNVIPAIHLMAINANPIHAQVIIAILVPLGIFHPIMEEQPALNAIV